MRQFPSPKVEGHPGYFPMGPDRRTPEQTSGLSSRPEEMIDYFYLTSDQSAPSTTWNPLTHGALWFTLHICNLHAVSESGFHQELPASGLANSILNLFFSIPRTPGHTFLWTGARRQTNQKKRGGVLVTIGKNYITLKLSNIECPVKII